MLNHRNNPSDRSLSRRDLLQKCGMGLGALTLASILGETRVSRRNPLQNSIR